MALEDFEKELAEEQANRSRRKRDRSRSRSMSRDKNEDGKRHTHRHRYHHHHRSSRYGKSPDHQRNTSRRPHKRPKHRGDERQTHKECPRQTRASPPTPDDEEDEWVEKEAITAPASEELLGQRIAYVYPEKPQRDAWMEAPSPIDIDYVQRRKRQPTPPTSTRALKADYELKLHKNEINLQLQDLQEGKEVEAMRDEPAQHEVNYTFEDAGSSWRMTKLKAVYKLAKEAGRPIDDVALERYGDLRDFDDAREEEIELDRRSRYGKDYVGKIKPSGELFQERKLELGIRRSKGQDKGQEKAEGLPQGEVMEELPAPAKTVALDSTALNRLKAQMMKAKLKGAPNAAELEAEYSNAMSAAANRVEPGVVILSAMDNRMLASAGNEVTAVDTKRGRERGLVEENEDMTIADMVRQEKRTRGQAGGEGRVFAESIAKDGKFDNDLDYINDNATRLAKRVQKSEINLRNTTINDFQKMSRILETCPLCHHEDTSTPPIAPIVSLATRTYLTLPTEPEISEGGACIVPIQHRLNLLECDDDEWEEFRNFMKCLTRMYHSQGRDVIFYENAAHLGRKRHATMNAVPLPYSLGETAPAFFKEAILSADEEWTQHKKLIDTLARAKDGLGKLAFRRSLVKEMPYFHVWFEMDGGLGHVVEDESRWPKGDLFAREVLGGMLDVEAHVVRKQGRWVRGDRRVEGFRKRWAKFDWTRVLTDG